MNGFLKFLAVLTVVFLPLNSFALNGIEVFTGYLGADIKDKDDYEAIPLFLAFDFNLKPSLNRAGFKFKGNLNFVFEPFFNTVLEPDTNIEAGANFLLKYDLPLGERLRPYLKSGLGLIYMSEHTREQSTQYNFLPQIGAGFHIFLDRKTALSFEYRYRHLSNSDIRAPNKGIDANLILAGVAFFF